MLIFPFPLIVGKGVKEWICACLDFSLFEHKLATLVKTQFVGKVTMFEQCVVYRTAIIMCYSH